MLLQNFDVDRKIGSDNFVFPDSKVLFTKEFI